MKKGLAVMLVVFGSILIFFGISFANLMLYLLLLEFGVVLGIILTAGAAFGIGRLRGVFERRYGFSSPKFFLCAYAPSVAAAGIYYLIFTILDSAKIFRGMMAGLLELLIGLSWLITAGVAAASGAVILIISANIRAKKGIG